MKRVIKAFQKFDESLQEAIYDSYLRGDLERASFPFQGDIAQGVIYEDDEEEVIYLVPIETIKSSKLSMSSDDDDDDDNDNDDTDDLGEAEDVDNDMDDEE